MVDQVRCGEKVPKKTWAPGGGRGGGEGRREILLLLDVLLSLLKYSSLC